MQQAKRGAEAIAIAAVTLAVSTGPVIGQGQVPGAFRSRVVLVPVDVRVVDRAGQPVAGLTRDDFEIFEDGRPQAIGHFSAHRFEPGAVPTGSAGPALRRAAGLSSDVPAHRTFLIVLGRGRLDGPASGLEALSSFVRDRLLPQDYVGLIAYNRTASLTTDHAAVLRFLERYRAEHVGLETLLRTNAGRRGSFHALFGRGVTPDVQRHIDALFEDPASLETRALPPLALDGVAAVEADWRRDIDARAELQGRHVFQRQSNDAAGGRMQPYATDYRLFAPRITIAGQQDLEKLYVGIEYLRYLEGEKHLVFLSEDGLAIGRPDHHDSLAAAASDARVTLSFIRTGGLPASLAKWGRDGWAESDWFFASDSRPVAAMTGGVATDFARAATGLDRLDRATRGQYLLGYYPGRRDWDGAFRRIEVRLTAPRPGVTVLHRGGYFGRDELVPFDRRRFLTHAWMVSAAAYRDRITDIGVAVTATASAADRVDVEVLVNPTHVPFEESGGQYRAAFEIAVFVAGDGDRAVGELWRTASLAISPGDYARLQSGEFIAYRAAVDVSGRARTVKAVAYDYDRDRLGTALTRVR